MNNIKFSRANNEHLNDIDKINGQIILVKDTKKLYFDIPDENGLLQRIEINGVNQENQEIINELYQRTDNLINSKMDSTDPKGTGIALIGDNVDYAPTFLTGSEYLENRPNKNCFIIGKYNYTGNDIYNADGSIITEENIPEDTTVYNENFAFVIGGGDSVQNRDNLFMIDWNGNCYIKGNIYQVDNFKIDTHSPNYNPIASYATKENQFKSGSNGGFIISNTTPEEEDSHEKLWIDTSKGNGILRYWNGNEWVMTSAIYS